MIGDVLHWIGEGYHFFWLLGGIVVLWLVAWWTNSLEWIGRKIDQWTGGTSHP